jgi:glycosyltransferase involved in cell wall biosynthesis
MLWLMEKRLNDKKQKLLVLSQLFYPEMVSTGQVLTELCEKLVELGVEVEVYCGPITVHKSRQDTDRNIVFQGIKIRRVWGTNYPKLHIWGRTINQVTFALSIFFSLLLDRSKRPILVVTNPPYLAFLCAFLRWLGIGAPFIFLIHDVYPDTAVQLGILKEGSVFTKIFDWINALTFKKAEYIIVIGRGMKNVIEEKMRRSRMASFDKIKTIYLWGEERVIKAVEGKPNLLLQRWGLEGKFVVIYSGNMGWSHDMETIMQAVRDLRDNKEIIFLFVGEGHKKKWMVNFAQKEGLRNCQFHTYVDKEYLGYSLTCADLGLVSLMKEQVGLSVPSKTYGLMAAGIPVVAVVPKGSEIAHLVTEERFGVLIEPGDHAGLANKILQYQKDPGVLKGFGENGKKAVEREYNLTQAAQEYYQLITGLQG